VAKPNYAFEKRQKEIAKKKKKEEKRLQKAGVDDSEQKEVQPISGNDVKPMPTLGIKQTVIKRSMDQPV
jgi:hypothetical protein